MNRTIKTVIFPFAFLLFASGAFAAEIASKNEEKLIGAWQENKGGAGGVVEYKADHTFVMYPPCNLKKIELNKAGIQSVGGTWKLTEADQLITTVGVNGKSFAIATKMSLKDDELVLTNKNGSVANKSGRYQGSLPPSC